MKAKIIFSVLILGLVSNSFGILIGSFEGGMDSWYANSPNTTAASTVGVTLGEESMQVVDPDGGWGGSIEFPLLDQTNAAELISAITTPGALVTADITTMNSDDSIPDWWGDMGLLVNVEGLWNVYDWQAVPIGFDPLTTSMAWELPDDARAAIAAAAASGVWANIGLLTNVGSTYTYYVDNIQIVPEPATLLLLGMGGVLIRKR